MSKQVILCAFAVSALLSGIARAQQFSVTDQAPANTPPGILFEVPQGQRSAGPVSVTIDTSKIRRGGNLVVRLRGQDVEFVFEKIMRAGNAITWIGARKDAAQDKLWVSLTPEGVYATMQLGVTRTEVVTTPERGSFWGQRLSQNLALRSERAYGTHTRIVALDRLGPERLRMDEAKGRVLQLRASGLGRLETDGVVPSEALRTVLAMDSDPDLRPIGQDRFPDYEARHPYRIFQQRIRGLPVSMYVRFWYDANTLEISELDGRIFSDDEAPKTDPADLTAGQSVNLARDKLVSLGETARAVRADPVLEYAAMNDGGLTLGWSMTLETGTDVYSVFVDAKTGEVRLSSLLEPTHTCRALDPDADSCEDEQNTEDIIDAAGDCLNHCSFPHVIENAHRDAWATVNDTLGKLDQAAHGGVVPDFDPDIISDSSKVQGNVPAGTIVDHATLDGYIYAQNNTALHNDEAMAHESVHVWVDGKQPGMIPTSENYDPAKRALGEGIAYTLDETLFHHHSELHHDGAHIDGFVVPMDPNDKQENATAAEQNSHILQEAMYQLIQSSKSHLGLSETEITDLINVMIPKAVLHLPYYFYPYPQGDPADPLIAFMWAIDDALEDLDDEDLVTGSQERTLQDDMFHAFGTVGVGPYAQSSGGGASNPPTPATPYVFGSFYACGGSGETWWEVDWAPVAYADFYPVYSTGEVLELIDFSSPFWVWVNNYQLYTHIHACGEGGCSTHSNAVFIDDICGG